MVKQRQSVVIVFRSKYLHEKICKREQGTKRKGVKKIQIIVRKRGLKFNCLFQFLL